MSNTHNDAQVAEAKHSPLPLSNTTEDGSPCATIWDAGGDIIASCRVADLSPEQERSNATRFVRAVNTYDALVDIMKRLVFAADAKLLSEKHRVIGDARALLAKIEAEEVSA